MKLIPYGLSLVLSFALCPLSFSQTTLTGNHIVAGATGGSAGTNLKVTGDGGVLFEGTYGTGTLPSPGSNPFMLWYPKKGAFRIGDHDLSAIGNYSMAYGYESVASGDYSFAGGSSAASGSYSVALGYSTVEGAYSAALGGYNYVMDDMAAALGFENYVSNPYGMALGLACYVFADHAKAFGYELFSTSFASTVLGAHNMYDYEQSTGSWVATDDLLVVGNGATSSELSNAMVMRKNAELRTGSVIQAKGVMRAAPGGGLGMGSFTAGQDPSTLDSALRYSGE